MRNLAIPGALFAVVPLFAPVPHVAPVPHATPSPALAAAPPSGTGRPMTVVCEAADAVVPVGRAAAGSPAVLDGLIGSWTGEGSLFGQPTGFRMTWAPELGGRFLGLSYEILGDVAMSARAHYRLGDGRDLRGVWVDSRGEILELEAVAVASRLVTTWRSPSETGRTVYRLDTADSLMVCDFVADGEGWRLFGTARYVRREAG